MSRNARFYFFAGMLAILLLFVALALSGTFALWDPPAAVKGVDLKR